MHTSSTNKPPSNDYLSKAIVLGEQSMTIHHLGETHASFREIRDDFGADLQEFCRDLLTRKSIVFDIGAKIGLTSCIFSQHARRVYAFESDPPAFQSLKKNIETNSLANVIPYGIAIGAETTIDRIAGHFGLPRLDLIKIDVDGSEQDVLAGSRVTIRRYKPTIYMRLRKPCNFAEALYEDFGEVLAVKPSAAPKAVPDHSTNVVFQNFFTYGSVNDLILREPLF